MGSAGDSEIGVFENIRMNRIRHSDKMVRDAMGDLEELAASIRQNGLLEPLVVRPVGDVFEVVAGNRRLEACKRLHKKRVACHIVAMDEAASFELALVENVQRKMMNPIEEAVAFRKYVDDYGFGAVSQLARKIGKSQSYVSRRIALLELPESVLRKVEDGQLSSVIAQELLPLHESDAATIVDLMLKNDYSREDVRSMARAAKQRRAPRDELESLLILTGEETSRNRSFSRVMNKAITTVRVCMMRTDDTIESISDDEWLLKEALVDCRRTMHTMLDRLVRLKLNSRRRTQDVRRVQDRDRRSLTAIQGNDGHILEGTIG